MRRLAILTGGLLGLASLAAGQTGFLDVPPEHWAAAGVAAITSAGVMEGCGGPFFCLDEPVTREDMAVWLERVEHGASYRPPAAVGLFVDVPRAYCLAPWIEQLYRDGITAGCSVTPRKYCPFDPVNRAQMAVFLLRVKHGASYRPPNLCDEGRETYQTFEDVPCTHWAADWIEQLYAEGFTAGCSVSPPLYCPYDSVNRAQMAVFLSRALGLLQPAGL